MARKEWAGNTFGTGRMHIWLIRILRFVDVRAVYVFSYIFVIPFCLLLNRSRRTSWYFYRRRLGYSPLRAAAATYVNHCKFAQVVIDRFAMYAGKTFDVEVVGRDVFEELAVREEGFVMLSSHIGNYELAGYSLKSDKKPINAVVYGDEKETVMSGRSDMFSKTNNRMITLGSGMDHLIAINNALSGGEIVSFPADRHTEGSRCIKAEFLGKAADFPAGPFKTAAMHGCSALAVNVMKTAARKYRIYVTHLEYDKTLPRAQAVEMLSKAYVRELERMIGLYPTQWYNFFDFWAW